MIYDVIDMLLNYCVLKNDCKALGHVLESGLYQFRWSPYHCYSDSVKVCSSSAYIYPPVETRRGPLV